MDVTLYIALAYATAGVLILALCLNTWLGARAARRHLAAQDSHEA